MNPSDLELIRGVRSTPALFNSANPDFKFADRKEKIWTELATYLGVNVDDARRRWTCLRDRYSRELKIRRENPEAINFDYGAEEFFAEMDFLRPFVRKRRERRSIICNIKSNSVWKGKNDQSNFNIGNGKFSVKRDTSPPLNHDSVLNMDEVYNEYIDEKTIEVSSQCANELGDEEPIIPDGSYHEYHVDDNLTNDSTQASCDLGTIKADDMSRNSSNSRSKSTECLETEDDFFCKSIGAYLRQLSRLHKIKAKVEMYQILEKYIEIEES